MRAPLVPITLAFIAGILLATYAVHAPSHLVAMAAVISAAAAIGCRRTATVGLCALLLVWVAVGMFRTDVWHAHPDARLDAIMSDEPRLVRLHGIVVSDPVGPFDPDESGPDVCVVRVLHVRMHDAWQPIAGQIRATLADPVTPLSYGDEVVMEGEWSRAPAPSNPGQYDWREALARQRIHGVLRVKPFHGVVIVQRSGGPTWLAAIFRLRRRWEQLIRNTFPSDQAGLLLSLLLGERVALDERLTQAFVETGTIHLLVISGFNVGLVALLFELLFRLAGIPWRIRLLCSALALGGYCILTGLQPPVVRATLMAWIVLGAQALDCAVSWPNTLAAAALAILWFNPAQLFDPGFQLSFGAVVSLLVFAGRWQVQLEPRLKWVRPAWLARFLIGSLSATGAVWAGLSPVLAWYFHLVSPVSMLANLLLAPLLTLLVPVGTAILLLGMIWEGVMQWTQGVLAMILTASIWCVRLCHAIPGGCWYVGHPAALWIAGYYALAAATRCRIRLGWSPGRLLILWLAGFMVWVWSLVAQQGLDSQLRVDVLDVGHGNSILLRTPDHRAMLVDAGSREAGRFRVLPFLRHEGVTRLDALVLTRIDEDHLGGAIPILQQLRVARLLTNGVRGDTMSARWLRDLARRKHIPETSLSQGMILPIGQGASISVLRPPSNDNSLALNVVDGIQSILLTDDRALLGVRPRLAIFSVGYRPHGPSPETMQALSRTGALVYSTRHDGAVTLRTDGARVEVRTFRDRR